MYKTISNGVKLTWEAKIPALIWGPPGVGKSAIVKDIARSQEYTIEQDDELAAISPRLAKTLGMTFRGRQVFDCRLVLCNPTDIKGIPVFNSQTQQAVWVMTGLFPTAPSKLRELKTRLISAVRESGPGSVEVSLLEEDIERALHEQYSVVFFDEIGQAPPMVQAAALQLVLDRKAGTYSMPDGCDIVAASNRGSDHAGAGSMITPLISRFIHFIIDKPDFDGWERWALGAGIETDVIAYLKFNPADFFKFDASAIRTSNASRGAGTFPCPRTWEFVSRLISRATYYSDAELEIAMEGTVGPSAITFIAWRKLYRKIATPEEFFLQMKDVHEQDFWDNNGRADPSLQFAFTLNCLRFLKEGKIKGLDTKNADSAKLTLDPHVDRFVNFMSVDWKSAEWVGPVFSSIMQDFSDESLSREARNRSMAIFKNTSFRKLYSKLQGSGAYD